MAANNTLNVWLLELRDTEANLTSNWDASTAAKTLSAGRLAFAIDTGSETRYKIGDGTTSFANLPWNTELPYTTCSTTAGTAAKSVTGVKGFVFSAGQRISIKFTATNTASSTLSVNGSTAKPIYYGGSALGANKIVANRIYDFIYNGSQWELVGDLDTDANTDTKVKQTTNTAATERALIINTGTASGSSGEVGFTDTSKLKVQPSTGKLTSAGGFVGNLTGTADKATAINTSSQIGSATKPIYITSDGTITEGTQIAAAGYKGVTTGTANNDTVPTLGKVNDLLSDLNNAIRIKGSIGNTIGTNGATLTDIPTSGQKEGYAYKIVDYKNTSTTPPTKFALTTSNSADGVAHQLDPDGDMIVWTADSKWLWIPAGDDVLEVTAGAGLTTTANSTSDGGTITSTGTLNLTVYNSDASSASGGEKAYTPSISGTTLKVPKITYDKYGRVKKIEDTTLTTTNTDTLVKQTKDTGTTERALIISNGTATATAGEVGFTDTSKLKVKPSTGDLTSAGKVKGNTLEATTTVTAGTSMSAGTTITAANEIYAGGLTSSAKGTDSGETIVGKVNAWNLVQTTGDVLILNGNI